MARTPSSVPFPRRFALWSVKQITLPQANSAQVGVAAGVNCFTNRPLHRLLGAGED